jgi:hypothetical protein
MNGPTPCGHPKCRAYHMTVGEFERLGGEPWTQGFRVRLGLQAKKLFTELYGKAPKKVRSSTRPAYRNKVGKYPCGILEQAYRELKGTQGETHPVGALDTREDQTTSRVPKRAFGRSQPTTANVASTPYPNPLLVPERRCRRFDWRRAYRPLTFFANSDNSQ